MKTKATLLYSAVFVSAAAGLSLLFWHLYGHDLDYDVYYNSTYAYSEHYTEGFRLFTAVAPSLPLAALVTWLLSWIRRRSERSVRSSR
jgi:hypothetical protein